MSKTAVQSLMEKLKVFQGSLSADEQKAFASMMDLATRTEGTLSAEQMAKVSGGMGGGDMDMGGDGGELAAFKTQSVHNDM